MKNKIEFIAEIGMNHNGNFDLCFELIKQAKLSGADIVKFQLGWRDKPGEINCINKDVINKLKRWCEYFEIELLFSIITHDAFKLIKPFKLKRYKVASRTVIDKPDLVKKIVNENKETIISLGMWRKKSLPIKKNKNIKYLWCLSKYPCEPRDLKNLPKNFNNSNYAGYSDHSIGIETCLIAISRGAKIIEKHFTLDKSNTTIRDHALSATPGEFKLLVDLGNDISKKINIGV
jgi:N,N'-diacetyllegionaminate synthase